MKHTPGPLVFDGTNIVAAHGHPIGFATRVWASNLTVDMQTAAANAMLWAASPDLLAALEKAVADYGQPGGPWNVPSEPGTWIEMAKDAIQKAKGE